MSAPSPVRAWRLELQRRIGGPARLRVVLLFACVLGLDTADLASLGAIAGQLKPALHLSNTELGVLAAAPSLVAAIVTLPIGVLADRVKRSPLLALTTFSWAGGMLLSGAASSFTTMLAVRLILGAATAASGPLVASLVGDLFRPGERGRIYGYILSGQLLGSVLGLLAAGTLAQVSWRAGLWVLALPSIALAWAIWRMLPEPARGGAGRLPASRRARRAERPARGGSDARADERRDPAVKRAVRRARVSPRRELVLRADPERMPLWQAVRYVLRVRTNVILIAASALGYFFQAGVNTFGVVFVIAHFGVSQAAATSLLTLIAIGALAGTVGGGRLADALLGRGYLPARMVVGGGAFVLSAIVFVPGLLSRDLAVSMLLYLLAAAALSAPGPALDAARLDIMPSRLWGRAEAIRTVLRTLAVAAAPMVFGLVSDALAPGPRETTRGIGYHASGPGLQYAFLLMLLPMAASGLLLLRGARAYPRDVATALASEANAAPSRRRPPSRRGARKVRTA